MLGKSQLVVVERIVLAQQHGVPSWRQAQAGVSDVSVHASPTQFDGDNGIAGKVAQSEMDFRATHARMAVAAVHLPIVSSVAGVKDLCCPPATTRHGVAPR